MFSFVYMLMSNDKIIYIYIKDIKISKWKITLCYSLIDSVIITTLSPWLHEKQQYVL